MDGIKIKKFKNKNNKLHFINPLDFEEKNNYFYKNASSILEAVGDDNKYLHLDVLGRITKPKNNKDKNNDKSIERKVIRTLSRQVLDGKRGDEIFSYYKNKNKIENLNDHFINTDQSFNKTNINFKNKKKNYINFSPERTNLGNSNNYNTLYENFKKNKKSVFISKSNLPSIDYSNNTNKDISKSVFDVYKKPKLNLNKSENNFYLTNTNKNSKKVNYSLDKRNKSKSYLLTSSNFHHNKDKNNLSISSNFRSIIDSKFNLSTTERLNEKKFIKTSRDIMDQRFKQIEKHDLTNKPQSIERFNRYFYEKYPQLENKVKYKIVGGIKILTVPKNFLDNIKFKDNEETIKSLKNLSKKENIESELFFNKLSNNYNNKTNNNFFESFKRSIDFVEKQNKEIKNDLIDIKKVYQNKSYYINPKHLAVMEEKEAE